MGNKDPYINVERKNIEVHKIEDIFQGKANEIIFEGGHEIKKEIINAL